MSSCGQWNLHYKTKTVWRPFEVSNGNTYYMSITRCLFSEWRPSFQEWTPQLWDSGLLIWPFLLICLWNTSWWRHQMETFSALLAICAENSPVPGEFPAQRPVTRSFDVFFDLRLNKWLSKQWQGWWFETLSHPLWRHRNDKDSLHLLLFLDPGTSQVVEIHYQVNQERPAFTYYIS